MSYEFSASFCSLMHSCIHQEAEGDTELSAWEKFAQLAYERLIAEEQANEE